VTDRPATVPVPRALVRRLWVGLGGAAVFTGIAVLQGAVRPDYDPWHQSVSALSLGPGGWVQQVNFVFFGVLLLVTVPTLRRMLAGGIGARSYPISIAIAGTALVVLGFVPQDPAPGYDPQHLALATPTALGLMHIALAGVTVGASVTGLFIMAKRFAHDPCWHRWATYTRIVALLTIACVVVYAVWSTHATGLAGTFERLAILATPAWGVAFAHRLGRGVPFMNAAGPPS
jgi:hypothetical protein